MQTMKAYKERFIIAGNTCELGEMHPKRIKVVINRIWNVWSMNWINENKD